MAIMGRKQKAVAQAWGAIDKQRKERNKQKNMEQKEISPEEHNRRIEALKKLGIIESD